MCFTLSCVLFLCHHSVFVRDRLPKALSSACKSEKKTCLILIFSTSVFAFYSVMFNFVGEHLRRYCNVLEKGLSTGLTSNYMFCSQ